MRILLVEPEFPIPPKSKNHSNFLPIGLLKLASHLRQNDHKIQLVRGNLEADFCPDQIFVTSLFTYWSCYVKDSVKFYRKLYPKAKITVGGIYATLMPEHCLNYTGCDEVFIGVSEAAERCKPAYDLVDVDYQIIHGMRGCTRKCPFCGIWRLEKKMFKDAEQIKSEISSNRIIFYDNNMLANPNIEAILDMLSTHRINGKPIVSECQSGFDGRIIEENPNLPLLLKKARFTNIRLAWDFTYEQFPKVKKWIELFEAAGFNSRSIFIFMIYNWSFDFQELEAKRKKCFEWKVQISDCRYRPLNQTFDNYNSHLKEQSGADYYIHSNWSDKQVREFRKNVRRHNICVRQKIAWDDYSREKEKLYARSRTMRV